VILDTDAVVDPGTVMVEAVNALIANRVVSRAGCSYHFALRAEVGRIDVVQKGKETSGFVPPDHPCILAACVQERKHYEQCGGSAYNLADLVKLGFKSRQNNE